MLVALPRLLARLNPQTDQYRRIEEILYQIEAGYAGEVKVDKYLESIEFLEEDIKILTDLELTITPKYSMQIDTLILTRSSAIILEIKNIAGTLTYISNPPHFERTHEDKKNIVIDCPIMQIANNKMGLDIWFERNGVPLKSSGIIVMANMKTSVKNAPHDIPFIYAKHLPLYFRERNPEKPKLTKQQFAKLFASLTQARTRYNPYPLCEKIRIEPWQITKGLICNNCNGTLARTNNLQWTCSGCGNKTKQPYADGLQVWFMLIKNTITNKECRDFFHLKDKHAANYVLKQLNLEREGDSKSTIYKWNYKISPAEITSTNRNHSRNQMAISKTDR